jgi:hypothetical protein
VNSTAPEEISALDGVYVVFTLFTGLKLPPLPPDQTPVLVTLPMITEPCKDIFALLEQTLNVEPGFTVGDGVNAIFIAFRSA